MSPFRLGRADASRRQLVLAVAAAWSLAGCASLAPRDATLPSTPVPATWSAPASSTPTSLASWWQRFGDATLTALVSDALQANTDVRSAQATLREARAARDVSAAQLSPVVGTSASAQRSNSSGSSTRNSFRLGFDASWEPDIFGARRSAVNASEADVQASVARLGDVQVSIAAEVALAYMQLRGFQAREAIARSNLAAQEETLQLTRWRTQAGLASSLEVEQALAATEQTRAQIPSLQTSIAQAQHSLALLTGRAPAALQERLNAASPVPQASNDLALNIPAETLRQRPDLRAAEHQISAALARTEQADAARYPSFQLSGSVGLSALTLGALSGSGALVGALLASVSAPIFDGGELKAQVRVQEAALERARVGYQATVLTALKDVEDALVAMRGDRERLERLRNAAQAADNAALLARQRYQSGIVDFQTVLDTQRTLLSTQDALASTQAELSADHVRLYKALGGGWQADGAVTSTSDSARNAPTRDAPQAASNAS
jgi:outer membrane protein, multidrug efflux system